MGATGGAGPSVICPHCGTANPRSLIVTLCRECGEPLETRASLPPPPPPPFEREAAQEPLPDDDGVPEPLEAEPPLPTPRARPTPKRASAAFGLLKLAVILGIAASMFHGWWGPKLAANRWWRDLLVGRKSVGPGSGQPAQAPPPEPAGMQTITFTGHRGTVWGVAFSPDSVTVATASEDRRVGLWHVLGRNPMRFLEGHAAMVRSVAFSPNGLLLASASFDNTVRIWEVARGTPLQVLRDGRLTFFPVWFPDGRHLATGTEDTATRIWDLQTGTLAYKLLGHSDRAWAVALSPDGRLLATGSRDRTVKLWDAQTGRTTRTLKGHKISVNMVAFSPDGKLLATGGAEERTVRLWSVPTGKPVGKPLPCLATVYEVAFSPDGSWLAGACANGTVTLWDARTRKQLAALPAGGFCVAFAPDGDWLASGSRNGSVTVWSRAYLAGLTRSSGR